MLKNVRNSITSSSSVNPTSGQQSNHQQTNNAQAIKNRNDPGRFFGDGVIFKAKLIGVLEVGEARGDRMCQEALQDLKTAIRAAGEHKQRITIHVTIDGLRLRDEKTSDCLYHHPVHKISFIAQDMTDSRAFGYIFGSPDSGHRFFGIKTDKAASQVVLAMRDLFQVVFELKKKEIELARQQIQSKTISDLHHPLTLNIKGSINNGSITALTSSKVNNTEGAKAKTSPESVADLVDLEQELNCLQRGINQMERITPSEPTPGPSKSFTEDDPFGDSFTTVVPSAYSILPPPESSSSRSSRHSKPVKPPESIPTLSNLLTSAPINNSTSSDNWLAELSQSDVFDTSVAANALHNASLSIAITNSTSLGTTSITYSATSSPKQATAGGGFEEFSLESTTNISQSGLKDNDDDLQDLDPLGTGKSKPYVDKKYFFHEIKNPPKKVLKELTTNPSAIASSDTLQPDSLVEMLEGNGAVTPKAPLASSDSYESNQSNEVQPPTNTSNQQQSTTTSDNTEDSSGVNSVMMARDTDPFSPTRKKSDPFQDGNEIFGKMDSTFQFDFEKAKEAAEESVYNGPLQVSLPPETPQITTTSSLYASSQSLRSNKTSGIKMNTVDVISTISSKTMPHLFGQKFSRRESPSINMRRLQESDSLSETEGAPEPPPRPDAIAQPPPLPPKKQFTDIIIRPRTTSISSVTSSTTVVIQPPPSSTSRYSEIASSRRPMDSSSTTSSGSGSAPPIPLPSRKVSRIDYSYPGPNRPRKPGCDEDNYLAPVSSGSTLPTLLPPPQQSKGRVGRRYESYDNRETNLSRSGSMKSGGSNSTQEDPIIPDITLSQLLTLGVDDLAKKLGVPASKLNTMTLVELTRYLAEYIERSSRTSRSSPQPQPPYIQPPPEPIQHSPRMRPVPQAHIQPPTQPVQFKTNFEDFNNSFNATFDAKFDDNFGEDSSAPFVANFSQFNEEPSKPVFSTPIVPSADRYAVFREIIDLELQNCPNDPTSSDEGYPPQIGESQIEEEEQKIPKIDTKITEAISNAKDRYAALRDIILVEDLFDKPKSSPNPLLRDDEERDDSTHDKSMETGTGTAADDESSPEEAHDIMDEESGTIPSMQTSIKDKFLTVTDDVEIDELMNRAISNLSLDSRDHLSPSNIAKSPQAVSPNSIQKSRSPMSSIQVNKSQFSDVSTSPIPLQKLVTVDEKTIPKSKSPIQSSVITSLRESTTPNKLTDGSMSDIVCNSSPDVEQQKDVVEEENESWACFDKRIEETEKEIQILEKQELEQNKESPCSSDGPKDWKNNKRWPKGQTSSSSRDLSPWDDEANDYKKRLPPNDRHGFYSRNSKRLNSCDDDYDYDEEMAMRRERKMKSGMSRSRDNFDFEPPGWYSTSGHHSWSPQDYEEARARAFERGGYDRTTYGPPFYDKRDMKMSSHSFYDRRGYDKRKYYRDRDYSGRTPTSNYDFESYGESYDKMSSKGRRDYENVYDDEFRGYGKSRPEYFYEGKSFDRESNESYESVGRRRRSFGSGDVYGSLESREDFRDRYTGEKARSLRKGMKIRSGASCEFEQDSENEIHVRRGMAPMALDSRSLQRPVSGSRIRKSSGSSPWDVAEADAHTPKNWKRPGSATESERRRNLGQTPTGSDGEKDKRFRKKQRYRSKDPNETRQARSHRDDYDDYMECEDYQQPIDEDKFERLNRRKHELHQRMGEVERRKKVNKYKYEDEEDDMDEDYDDPPMSRKDNSEYYMDKPRYASQQKFDAFDFDAYNDSTPSKPTSNTIRTSNSKFSYQEQGFESDFNASPPSQPVSQQPTAPSTAASTKSSFRFSNDFSSLEKDRSNFENPSTQKLRFDDKVTVSKFENDHQFEDDFSKNSEFDQNKPATRMNSKMSKQEIKKSESVNIFAKKSDDPFEDDDFFKSSVTPTSTSSHSAVTFANSDLGNGSRRRPSVNKSNVSMIQEEQQWEDNFAKFDENM